MKVKFGKDGALLRKYMIHRMKVVKAPLFYVLPKIHKTPLCGRPIVPSHSWITSAASTILDFVLRPILESCHTVLNDTTSLINIIERTKLDTTGVTLVTADIVSMYTNIEPEACIKNVSAAWDLRYPRTSNEAPRLAKAATMELLKITLCNNFFKNYAGTWYHQTKGLAMGTAVAPLLANIYMFIEEAKILRRNSHILYYRYIDDIIAIFKPDQQINQFFDSITEEAPAIKFTITENVSTVQLPRSMHLQR